MEIECTACGSEDVVYVPHSELYRCYECGTYFEDDVPAIENIVKEERTKLRREE
jgi:uncharacterized Zn finger protein